MKNQALRERIKANGLCCWQVAAAIGIAPSTFTAWLRFDLTPKRRERVEAALDALTNGGDEEAIKHGGS